MITEVMALEIESQKYFDFSYYKKDFALERELISERRRAQGLLIRQNFLTQYSKWMGWQRKNYTLTKEMITSALVQLKEEE